MADIKKLLADENTVNEIAAAAFKKVDTDGSGTIDKAELRALMDEASKSIGTTVSDQELNDIYNGLDKNKDGKLTLDEFTVLIRAVLEALAE